jgi:hypothetical protein
MERANDKIFKNLIIVVCIALVLSLCQQPVFVSAKSKITLSCTIMELSKGKSKKLKLKNAPSGAKITWSTTNKYAVTVSKKGTVKAVSFGNATIKAKYKGVTYACAVTVPDSDRTVKLNTNQVTIKEQETFQLTAEATKKVTFFSANNNIVTVDTQGFITAVNPGTTTVTAKTTTAFAKCTVTVQSGDEQVISPAWIYNRDVTGIRRLTQRGNIVYDNITWAKNKAISFKIDNLNEDNVKKCVWSSSDETVVSAPQKRAGSLITVDAKTLETGTAIITAKVTTKSGSVSKYTSYVYVTSPSTVTKEITIYGDNIGENRQQTISFSGLSKYSKISVSNNNTKAAEVFTYHDKIAVSGLKEGNGTITATIDGNSYKIKYVTLNPVISSIPSVISKGKTTKLKVSGIEGIQVVYSSRNKKIASIKSDGTIKGVRSGVTYVDVKFADYTLSVRVEVAATGMQKIINRATYIVNHWKYSQAKRMKNGYYDCSALVWKGYKIYKNYQKKLGSSTWAYSAGELFDYLYKKGQIVYFGYTGIDNMKPGDLIFYGDYENAVKYSTPGRTLDIYHVAMYAGNGEVVEKGGQTMNSNNTKYIVGIGRVVN